MSVNSLGKNIFWTVTSRFGSQVILAVSNILLARHLGGAGFGEYAFVSAILFVGNAFSTFGTDMILIRRIAASEDYSDVPAGLIIQLMISVLLIVVVFAFSPLLPATELLRIF